MAFNCDVLVVGAGPAGIAAALTLHTSGKRVIVIDKAEFPRDKCCGDGLTTGALRLLDELGFDPNTVASWRQCDAVWLRSPRGREMMMPLPRNSGQFAAIAPRLELDNALVVHARARGIEVRENHEFAALTQNDDHVVVEIEGRESITCRHVVAADGMWSPVRKSLGLSTAGYLGEWHAFRQYADNVTGPAKDRLYVWFEKDLLPGYAWSFPLTNGRVNIGFGILRGGKYSVQDMKQLWPELLARPHIAAALGASAVLVDRHTAWPIHTRAGDDCAAGRWLGAVCRRRGVRYRHAHRRRHRPSVAQWRARRAGNHCMRRQEPGVAAVSISKVAPATFIRRPPHVASARVCFAQPADGERCATSCKPHQLDATQLCPLDVRRRTARRRVHAAPLAPRLPQAIWRLRQLAPKLSGHYGRAHAHSPNRTTRYRTPDHARGHGRRFVPPLGRSSV